MHFDDFQEETLSTSIYKENCETENERVFYTTLGLVGEAGEIANKVKKVLRGDYSLDEIRKELSKEIGDVLFYCAALANELNISLDYIAKVNQGKLAKRKKEGKLKGSGDNR